MCKYIFGEIKRNILEKSFEMTSCFFFYKNFARSAKPKSKNERKKTIYTFAIELDHERQVFYDGLYVNIDHFKLFVRVLLKLKTIILLLNKIKSICSASVLLA